METFKLMVEHLDATLKKYNPSAYESLAPPLPNDVIDKNFLEIGIADENLKTLFQWKSGMETKNGYTLTEYGGLLTIDSIKALILMNNYYDPVLVPILSENGEQMLLFNTNPGPHYGKLYLYSVPQLYIDHPVSYYDSLSSMVATIIEAYEEKAYKYDKEDNWLNIDYAKYYEIAKKHNKNCVFWTDHDELWWEDWYEI